jgi:hypothetical protein
MTVRRIAVLQVPAPGRELPLTDAVFHRADPGGRV